MSSNFTSFGYLGKSYQVNLLMNIIWDNNFAKVVIPKLSAGLFDHMTSKNLFNLIKQYYETHNLTPNIDNVEQMIKLEVVDEITREQLLSETAAIMRARRAIEKGERESDASYIQKTTFEFIRQQLVRKVLLQAQEKLDSGQLASADELPDLFRDALTVGKAEDNGVNIFEFDDSLLENQYVDAIKMGLGPIDRITGGLPKGKLGMILAGQGIGKSLAISELLLTPDGFIPMGAIKVGDHVIGSNGKAITVTGVFPQGEREIYKVTFADGTTVNCDLEHLWTVSTRKARKRAQRHLTDKEIHYETLTLAEIIPNIKVMKGTKSETLNYKIPLLSGPIEFDSVNLQLPIEPYALGLSLGDGHAGKKKLPTQDAEVKKYLLSQNYDSKHLDPTVNKASWFDKIKDIFRVGKKPAKQLETKFIPEAYLHSSVENRIALFQGLMDTNGYTHAKGNVLYSTVSKELSEDFLFLVRSLGIVADVNLNTKMFKRNKDGEKVMSLPTYVITMSFNRDTNIVPFRLQRKISRVKIKETYGYGKFIISAEFSHKEEAVCIKVDAENELFVTNGFNLTHNTSLLNYIADTAFLEGKNVLQIIFDENSVEEVMKAHYAKWSEVPAVEFVNNKNKVRERVMEVKQKHRAGKLIIKRFSSDGTTIPIIKAWVKAYQEMYAINFELIVVDYIDEIESTKNLGIWDAQADVAKTMHSMLVDFNIPGWTATQGKKESNDKRLLVFDDCGGSVAKLKKAQLIISIGADLDQKRKNQANFTILKSNFSSCGQIYEDCTFNRGILKVDITESHDYLPGDVIGQGYDSEDEIPPRFDARAGLPASNFESETKDVVYTQHESADSFMDTISNLTL